MGMIARRAALELLYNGINISKDIAKDIKGFTYTDNASGTADDISVEIADTLDGKWINSWAPQKGAILVPKIHYGNWTGDSQTYSLDCGSFLIDKLSYSGRPRVLSIGAASVPNNTDFMTAAKSRTWQNATIKTVAGKIASGAKLGLFFDSKINPVVGFIEQSKESDSAFLTDLCSKYGLALKLYNSKIVIFSEMEYEARASIREIREPDMESYTADTSFTDTGYAACKIAYTDPKRGVTYNYTFKAPGRTGKTYVIDDPADSYAEAMRLARGKLRELNKGEFTLSIPVFDGQGLYAGGTVDIKDLGIFDGKYYIDRISRNMGATTLDLHRCLVGY